MATNAQAPRPTINGNNANVDSMLAKLNQRLWSLAANLGVGPKQAAIQTPEPVAPRGNDVLSVTSSHIDSLSAAHGTMDDIEATLGTQKS